LTANILLEDLDINSKSYSNYSLNFNIEAKYYDELKLIQNLPMQIIILSFVKTFLNNKKF